MKLDDYSINKLWDLMSMIFKWQITVATNQNIFDISRRHLKSIATLMPQYFPKCIIEHAMRRFEKINERFTDEDYKCLSNTLQIWFSKYQTKISVLLRLGLQKKDGTFSAPVSINPKILQNLGDNIYKYDNKKNPVDEYEKQCTKTSEINCLLASIDNERTRNETELQLPINLGKNSAKKHITLQLMPNMTIENINMHRRTRNTDLSYNPNIPKSTYEDLLDMLDNIDNE